MLGLPHPAPEPTLTMAPPPVLDHVRQHGAAAQIRSLQVDRHDAVERCLVGIQHRAERTDRRVVDQRIDPAVTLPASPQRLLQRRRRRIRPLPSNRPAGRVPSAPTQARECRPAAVLDICGASSPKATTECPSAASRSVMARPIPKVPPVTMTTRGVLTRRPSASGGRCRQAVHPSRRRPCRISSACSSRGRFPPSPAR